jgi:hypothetical protein
MGHPVLAKLAEIDAWTAANTSKYVTKAKAAALLAIRADLTRLVGPLLTDAQGNLLMAVKFSTEVRNARADAIESTISTTPVLKIRTGSAPASVATADAGTVLCTMTLPSDWWATASAGSKSKLGTWSGTNSATGAPGHFRIYASDGTTGHFQGTCTATGGGGDMTVTVNGSGNLVSGEVVSVNSFTWTEANS